MPPANIDPHSIDFAALKTLRLVHDLGSFTAAAEKLDVNQSAVSYTIDKLRRAFQDPLFVRERGFQVSTERCDQIVAKSVEMLDSLAALARPDEFHPEKSDRTVTIACNYYERILMIPRIITALRQNAPAMKVEVVNSRGDGHLRLLEREADVLIGPFLRPESGFYSRRLYSEEYVCLMDPEHPLAGQRMDVERYLDLDHILITYGGTWKSAYLGELERLGHDLRPTLSVPSPAGLQMLISGSSLVATVPRRLARVIGEGLLTCDCPVQGKFDLALVWTARTNASAMHGWLREIILKCCAQIGKESGN